MNCESDRSPRSRLLSRASVASACLVGTVLAASLSSAQSVPEDVAHLYAASVNPLVSDEFEGDTLDRDKWTYRTLWPGSLWGTGTEYVQMRQDGDDGYVSLVGTWDENEPRGSGIATKHETHFGFFSTRWRTDGIVQGSPTPWHPAIWMAAHNVSQEEWRSIPATDKNLEIDFVEYWHIPQWHSQAIEWDRNGPETFHKILRENDDFGTVETGWKEHGLEYNPDYMQLWVKENGEWTAIGNRIEINDDPNDPDAIHRDFASAGYWILSNKEHFDVVANSPRWRDTDDYSPFLFQDSTFDIDYFRHFELAVAPEPGTALVLVGLAPLLAMRRRRR